MSAGWVISIILAIGAVAWFFSAHRARLQARASRAPGAPVMHSLPAYHGWLAFIVATLPALFLFLALSWAAGLAVEAEITAGVSPVVADPAERSLAVGVVHQVIEALTVLKANPPPATYLELKTAATGASLLLPDSGADYMIPLALHANETATTWRLIAAAAALIASALGAVLATLRVRPRRRARNQVEVVMLGGLIAASVVAVLTTIGIVLSMLGETLHFFAEVDPWSFFFGTVWDPRFAAAGSTGDQGQFGLIPLLAGTLYIAFVALLVAVPVGLMAAIYMGEYASSRLRQTVKPLLELLAGIPTIVYGIFALVTLGPFLRDLSAALAGGTPFIQAQSVFTAGLVMGIMLIPLVSSLSDDVITAVPRAMRDGSLALGATRSETIRRVILPAALPGIVGAVLLTASRAIGETMIVVLAAGVAARLSANPFEAMTTITVKIVNQLTGDLEFNSPQTLVAFALGLTLFALTLGMNIYALHVVRKYREQYE